MQQRIKLFQRLYSFGVADYFYSGAFLFGLAYFLIFTGHAIWRSTFHNYAIENFNVGPEQIGLIFSFTAVPGLLTFFVGFASQKIKILYLLISTFFMLGFGLIWISQPSTWMVLWIGSLSISMGFTFIYPITNALCLLGSPSKSSARVLGRLKGFGPLAAICSAILILYILPLLGFHAFFMISGTAILAMGIFLSFIIHDKYMITKMHGRFRFRIKLWPYYTLNFISGCRSALFKAFVLYLMIHEYQLEIHQTALIVLAGNFFNFIGYRVMGSLTQRYGFKRMLSSVYFSVAIIFLGFCFAKTQFSLSILFLLDSLFFCSSVATDSYLKDRVIDKELISCLSTGVSFFYIAGIIAPFAGGLLWNHLGYQTTFLLGCILALMAIVVIRKFQTV